MAELIVIRVVHTHTEGTPAHVVQHTVQDERPSPHDLTPEEAEVILAKVHAILAEHFPLPPPVEKEEK